MTLVKDIRRLHRDPSAAASPGFPRSPLSKKKHKLSFAFSIKSFLRAHRDATSPMSPTHRSLLSTAARANSGIDATEKDGEDAAQVEQQIDGNGEGGCDERDASALGVEVETSASPTSVSCINQDGLTDLASKADMTKLEQQEEQEEDQGGDQDDVALLLGNTENEEEGNQETDASLAIHLSLKETEEEIDGRVDTPHRLPLVPLSRIDEKVDEEVDEEEFFDDTRTGRTTQPANHLASGSDNMADDRHSALHAPARRHIRIGDVVYSPIHTPNMPVGIIFEDDDDEENDADDAVMYPTPLFLGGIDSAASSLDDLAAVHPLNLVFDEDWMRHDTAREQEENDVDEVAINSVAPENFDVVLLGHDNSLADSDWRDEEESGDSLDSSGVVSFTTSADATSDDFELELDVANETQDNEDLHTAHEDDDDTSDDGIQSCALQPSSEGEMLLLPPPIAPGNEMNADTMSMSEKMDEVGRSDRLSDTSAGLDQEVKTEPSHAIGHHANYSMAFACAVFTALAVFISGEKLLQGIQDSQHSGVMNCDDIWIVDVADVEHNHSQNAPAWHLSDLRVACEIVQDMQTEDERADSEREMATLFQSNDCDVFPDTTKNFLSILAKSLKMIASGVRGDDGDGNHPRSTAGGALPLVDQQLMENCILSLACTLLAVAFLRWQFGSRV